MLTATAARASSRAAAKPATKQTRLKAIVVAIGAKLNEGVSAQSLAAFRIMFGTLTALSTIRFIAKGWVQTLYIEPANHLTYPGFGWVAPWPQPYMYLHMAAMLVCSLLIAIGFKYKFAVACFFVLFTYAELIDAALYLNHYWFVSLAALGLLFLPANCYWSVDAHRSSAIAAEVVPKYMLWLLRAQIGMVYVFAGIAKINPAWLLDANPLDIWLQNKSYLPIVGELFSYHATALIFSWLAVLFDLTIVGWLSWRRSRPLAYFVLAAFHVITGLLFPIGVFPLVMVCAATVFFSPTWPASLLVKFRWGSFPRIAAVSSRSNKHCRLPIVTLVLLGGFLMVQLALPMRHYIYNSNVRWSEEGYYGAWRVMVSEKAGSLQFVVTDPETGETWQVDPANHLTSWQVTQASIRPDLVHAAAHVVSKDLAAMGVSDAEVRVNVFVSLNGGRAERLVDPDIDLAAVGLLQLPDGWILQPTQTESAGRPK